MSVMILHLSIGISLDLVLVERTPGTFMNEELRHPKFERLLAPMLLGPHHALPMPSLSRFLRLFKQVERNPIV